MSECRRIQSGADPARVNYDCVLMIISFLEDLRGDKAAVGLFGAMDSTMAESLSKSSPCCK